MHARKLIMAYLLFLKQNLSDVDINPVDIISGEMRSIAATFQGIRIINFYVVNGQALGF